MAKSKEKQFLDDYVSWDGKDFNRYISTDYDAFEDEEGRPLVGGAYYEARQKARPFLNPLRAVGMDEADMQRYARKAGIRNVNSQSDLAQILEAWESDQAPKSVSTATQPETAPTPTPAAPTEPTQPVYKYGDPTRPGAFAGSYFDWLGGDVSDPRNYYMYGSTGPDGIARSMEGQQFTGAEPPVRTVPQGLSSFMSPLSADFDQQTVGTFKGPESQQVYNEATLALQQLIRGYYS